MRKVHHELAKVSHWIMFPFLVLLIIGISVLIIVLQNPQNGEESILSQWIQDPLQNH